VPYLTSHIKIAVNQNLSKAAHDTVIYSLESVFEHHYTTGKIKSHYKNYKQSVGKQWLSSILPNIKNADRCR